MLVNLPTLTKSELHLSEDTDERREPILRVAHWCGAVQLHWCIMERKEVDLLHSALNDWLTRTG